MLFPNIELVWKWTNPVFFNVIHQITASRSEWLKLMDSNSSRPLTRFSNQFHFHSTAKGSFYSIHFQYSIFHFSFWFSIFPLTKLKKAISQLSTSPHTHWLGDFWLWAKISYCWVNRCDGMAVLVVCWFRLNSTLVQSLSLSNWCFGTEEPSSLLIFCHATYFVIFSTNNK